METVDETGGDVVKDAGVEVEATDIAVVVEATDIAEVEATDIAVVVAVDEIEGVTVGIFEVEGFEDTAVEIEEEVDETGTTTTKRGKKKLQSQESYRDIIMGNGTQSGQSSIFSNS